MMKLDALLFAYADGKGNPIPVQNQLDLTRCPELVDSLQSPVAYVVRNDELDSLRDSDPPKYLQFVGTKTGAELSRILLNRKRVPFLKTTYSVRGKLISSICDLLTRAVNINERNIYLIGTQEALFANLWRHAGEKTGQNHAEAADGSGRQENWKTILNRLRNDYIPKELRTKYVGVSERAELVRHLIVCAGKVEHPVLVMGETGTGKEIVARMIHDTSERKGGPFEPVNCAAIPEYLLESELFGHKKGSFNQAYFDKMGMWEKAQNGTLFLDEIGDLSPAHQAKILRALEKGEIRRVGETRTIQVNARVVAATNKNLYRMVEKKEFRDDLLFRLNAFLIPTPPLHQHPEDIPPLANHFWREITKDSKGALPEAVISELQKRRWPGNAREIKALLMCVHTLVGTDHVDAEILRAALYNQDHPGED